MSRKDFNDAGLKFNDYTLKLRHDAGGRHEDPDPLSQAGAFRAKLSAWLGQQGEKDSGHVQKTETIGPSADGLPQVRIICTEECYERINKKFGWQIRETIIAPVKDETPEAGSIYPPDRNCWDPTKWKKPGAPDAP